MKPMILYGGFSDGKLDLREIDDKWGGSHHRRAPALFYTRKEARLQYKDVRRVAVRAALDKRQRSR